MTEPDRWLVKIRRYGGALSVIATRATREEAQAIADGWNTRYQTDVAYVEEFDIDKQDWPGGRP